MIVSLQAVATMPDDGARLVGALEAMSKREIGGPRVPAAYGGERREPAALPINARRAIALAAIAEAAVSTKPEKLKGSVPQIVLHVRSGQGTARAATATEAVGAGNVCGFAGRVVPERNVCVAQGVDSRRSARCEVSLRSVEHQFGHDFAESSAHIAGATAISMTTTRRMSCDAAIVTLFEHADGAPLSIGRRSRTIPPAIRRALQSRDVGCRFPGCNHAHFLHAHHIQHWADGGHTSMRNLVTLCSFHHKLVHEGGYSVQRRSRDDLSRDELVFCTPLGGVIAPSPSILRGETE